MQCECDRPQCQTNHECISALRAINSFLETNKKWADEALKKANDKVEELEARNVTPPELPYLPNACCNPLCVKIYKEYHGYKNDVTKLTKDVDEKNRQVRWLRDMNEQASANASSAYKSFEKTAQANKLEIQQYQIQNRNMTRQYEDMADYVRDPGARDAEILDLRKKAADFEAMYRAKNKSAWSANQEAKMFNDKCDAMMNGLSCKDRLINELREQIKTQEEVISTFQQAQPEELKTCPIDVCNLSLIHI